MATDSDTALSGTGLSGTAADSDTGAQSARQSSGAISKAFAVLRVLRRASAPLPLTTIAEQIGMAPSSVHSILTQLLEQDAVEQDQDKRYQLGPAMFYVGSAYARDSRVSRSIWFELVAVANELGVTAVLAVTWEDHHFILNVHRAGEFNIAVPPGGRVPLDAGSWGKAYYAWSGVKPPAKLHRYTAASITDPKQFARDLEQVRQSGYGTDHAEFAEGVGGVCAAITSNVGYEGLASFVGPLARIEEIKFAELGQRISGLAARASLTLGDRNRVPLFGFE